MRILVLIVSVGLLSGCQSMPEPLAMIDIPSGIPWKAKPRARKGDPVRLADTWTHAVRNQSGQPAQRGFGGKVFFYDRKGTQPIEVEGQFVVYAFDENDREEHDQRPTRRYVFPPEQMALHMSYDKELGPSYSFWLPWDEAGGEPRDVSLMARFQPLRGGEMLVGDQSSHRLPGQHGLSTMIAKSDSQSTGNSQSDIQQVSYDQDATASGAESATADTAKRLSTTSIALPTSVSNRASLRGRQELTRSPSTQSSNQQ